MEQAERRFEARVLAPKPVVPCVFQLRRLVTHFSAVSSSAWIAPKNQEIRPMLPSALQKADTFSMTTNQFRKSPEECAIPVSVNL